MSRSMLFFGCWERPGHELRDQYGTIISGYDRGRSPFRPGQLDDTFAPRGVDQREDVTNVVHVHGWTVLAMWDRSVDTRGGCNAAFLDVGHHDEAEMWRRAHAAFPRIAARLKAAQAFASRQSCST